MKEDLKNKSLNADPLISIIVPAYNRENTVGRTIESILNQTYKNFEIIAVDDGSTDNTLKQLENFKDKRIRIIKHNQNKGVSAAKNTGFNHIKGDWFTSIDSDDEILPDALETLIRVPFEVDTTITAVSCNCLDVSTNLFSGTGVERDQYMDEEMIIAKCRGDFWGITRTELLGNDRFNEEVPGIEDTLWYKINSRAKRYYIHKALLLYHTEGNDRISKKQYNIEAYTKIYNELIAEKHFQDKIRSYDPVRYQKYCIRGVICLSTVGYKENARYWLDQLKPLNRKYYYITKVIMTLPPVVTKNLYKYILEINRIKKSIQHN